MLFSQREGIKPVKPFQTDSMDNELKNGLWNTLKIFYWDKIQEHYTYENYLNDEGFGFLQTLYSDLFKVPLDNLHRYWNETYLFIRKRFDQLSWHEVYDLVEFVASIDFLNPQEFMKSCNSILEREMAAYRFVSGKITKITSEKEIAEIEESIEKSTPLKGVNTHLKTALDLMSDRKNPDYRNSIKESISAVEALCGLIAKKPKAILSEALALIESKSNIKLHKALKDSFDKLYGYTSDADGIRHSLLKETDLSFQDAKYMLVSCAAFVNYLLDKADKAGLKL